MSNGADIAAVIIAGTAAIAALGRGIAWLLDFALQQANTTIDTQKTELKAKDERIDLLEDALRSAGIPVPQ